MILQTIVSMKLNGNYNSSNSTEYKPDVDDEFDVLDSGLVIVLVDDTVDNGIANGDVYLLISLIVPYELECL
ncbi:hypothetical protein BLOT_009918 [Blomia tropicalis]|nr:hypothetical protein BLOT_009918 [Blomia tropicalis]